MGTLTDSELLRDIAAGDEAALRMLYERHAGWLLLRRLHHPAYRWSGLT
jgi:RNA polymerase sigma-70 factor (ECF subfamily)